jgi:hypothetical protein
MAKVVSITPAGREDVYNMTVDTYHNYLIEGGIILKNCDGLRYLLRARTKGVEAPKTPEELEIERLRAAKDRAIRASTRGIRRSRF